MPRKLDSIPHGTPCTYVYSTPTGREREYPALLASIKTAARTGTVYYVGRTGRVRRVTVPLSALRIHGGLFGDVTDAGELVAAVQARAIARDNLSREWRP